MMFRRSLLSLAVASSVALTGCLDSGGDTSKNVTQEQNPTTNPARDGRVYPVFNPVESDLPIPNDIIFDKDQKDGTFGVPPDPTKPPITALNELSGASTVAPIDLRMSGKIDPDTVDANPIALIDGVPMPNPNQSVFLIELDYASGDPLQALTTTRETPTIPAATEIGTLLAKMKGGDNSAAATLMGMQAKPDYEASVIQLSGQDFIRITPLKPLNPNKRYVVVVTNDIKDVNGQPILQSSAYETITGDGALGNDALAELRTLMNGLWEPIATNYFQLTNAARPAAAKLSDKNIALSYSFTTSNDEKVLSYIANPASWFSDQIKNFVRVKTAATVVATKNDVNSDGKVDYADVALAAAAAIDYFPVNPSNPTDTTVKDALAPLAPILSHPSYGGCDGVTSGSAYIDCIGMALAKAPDTHGGFANLLPKPKLRTPTTTSSMIPVSLLSAPVASLVDDEDNTPFVAQGTIPIPYYLGVPTAEDGSAIVTQSWKADNELAAAINATFSKLGLEIPQADPARSTAVNSIFPFPKQVDGDSEAAGVNEITIPWLAVYPNPSVTTGPYPTVIYQHGITTDRSTALSMGTLLAQSGIAVIAIDHVGHGVVPATEAEKLALAETLLTAGVEKGLPFQPTAENKQAVVNGTLTVGAVMTLAEVDATTAQSMISAVLNNTATYGAELDTVIRNLKAFENTVANAGSTIPGIAAATEYERHFNFTANAASQPVAMDPENPTAQDSSGGLFINLTNFTNTRDNLRQGVVDLLNLRQSLGAIDLGIGSLDAENVYFAGHSMGGITGTAFVAVSNESEADDTRIKGANLLGTGGGIVRMLENSPTFAPRILGGLAAAAGLQKGDADLETFFNIFQATIDTVDPINFADNLASQGSRVLLTEMIGDTVIPNSAEDAPLSGTEPLAAAMGAADITEAGVNALPGIVRYAGATHSTPVLPTSGKAEETAAFTEMMKQTGSIVATGSGLVSGVPAVSHVVVTDPTAIQQ